MPVSRAQRLSASKELSLPSQKLDGSFPFVLNAFRHQRNSHDRRGECGEATEGAQRLSASKELSQARKFIAQQTGEVLNAFRHQRNSHAADCRFAVSGAGAQRLSASKELSQRLTGRPTRCQPCSTPFGIKGTLTRMTGQPLGERNRCSTPFGIKGTLTQSELLPVV